MQLRNKILPITLAVVIFGGAGWYLYRDIKKLPENNIPQENSLQGNQNATTTDDNPTITILPPNPAPSELDRPLVFKNSNLSDAQKQTIEDKIKELIADLRKNPGHYEAWLDLGLNRKDAGDYEGARDAWERAVLVDPSRSVAYGNLGVVYGFYLGNQPLAEKNFNEAINIDPQFLYLYGQFSDFYKNIVKDIAKAKEVLRRAQDANPKDRAEIQKIIDSF